jgi:hypothetical protein
MKQTPEQEAKELIEKFDDCLSRISIGDNGIEDALQERAKACALIYCNGMIKTICDLHIIANSEGILASVKYWEQVKEAINHH